MIVLSATPARIVAPAAAEYRLSIAGAPGQRVRLRASRVPNGWFVAFCTGKVCEPSKLDEQLSNRGKAAVDLRVFPRDDPHGAPPSFVILSSDGARLSITSRQ